MFTVIVTGSRDLTDWNKVWKELEDLFQAHGSLMVRHGGCPSGADRFATMWIDSWYKPTNIIESVHPAGWDRCTPECPPGHRRMKAPGDTVHPGLLPDYCPKAGPRRNADMAALGADLCLAFPLGESRGTWNCVNECKKAGIPVKVIE